MKYTNLKDYDFYEIGMTEAMNLNPIGPTDKAVTVHCHGQVEHWKSRAVCAEFYKAGSLCTGGSESQRYAAIYDGCINGDKIPSDGMAIRKVDKRPLTNADIERLNKLRKEKEELGNSLDTMRANNEPTEKICEVADKWNNTALEIIKLEKRLSYTKDAA